MKKQYSKNNIFPGANISGFKLEPSKVSALVFEHKSGCPKPQGGKCICTPKTKLLSAEEFLTNGQNQI